VSRVIELWMQGYDTAAIAEQIYMREAEVERILNRALDERVARRRNEEVSSPQTTRRDSE
jgi:hypothetical protein